jgi:hypothetical protein
MVETGGKPSEDAAAWRMWKPNESSLSLFSRRTELWRTRYSDANFLLNL